VPGRLHAAGIDHRLQFTRFEPAHVELERRVRQVRLDEV
jgi:predicted YcjX-like family ATPase